MREAWKRKTYVRSQSFSSESTVKYLHVLRRKIQTSPPLGEQDQSSALTQGQQRQSNPHPMPCHPPPPPPPAVFTLIGALSCYYLINLPPKSKVAQNGKVARKLLQIAKVAKKLPSNLWLRLAPLKVWKDGNTVTRPLNFSDG